MPRIIAIIGNDSRGHQVRLSDGKEILVPYNAAHSLSIGDELEDPKAAHEIERLDQSQQPGHDESFAARVVSKIDEFLENHVPDIETGNLPHAVDTKTDPVSVVE